MHLTSHLILVQYARPNHPPFRNRHENDPETSPDSPRHRLHEVQTVIHEGV